MWYKHRPDKKTVKRIRKSVNSKNNRDQNKFIKNKNGNWSQLKLFQFQLNFAFIIYQNYFLKKGVHNFIKLRSISVQFQLKFSSDFGTYVRHEPGFLAGES